MRGALAKLKEDSDATLLACGRSLQWLDTDDAKKALQLLGTPADNMLAIDLETPAGPLPNLVPREIKSIRTPLYCSPRTIVGLPNARQVGNESLAGVASHDRLIILGHGNPRGGGIVYKAPSAAVCGEVSCNLPLADHKDKYTVDPSCLSALLEEDGLPKNHVHIECMMCFSAGLSDEALQTVQPYAQRLAEALRARSYSKVTVAGSRGMVIGPRMTARSTLQHEPEEGRYLLLSNQETYEDSLKWF